MSPFADWAEAVVRERIAELHREAERERRARRVRDGRARPVTSGELSTRDHSARRHLGWLRRLRRSDRTSGRWAEERARYVPLAGEESALRGAGSHGDGA